jgi:hypothetical protein
VLASGECGGTLKVGTTGCPTSKAHSRFLALWFVWWKHWFLGRRHGKEGGLTNGTGARPEPSHQGPNI